MIRLWIISLICTGMMSCSYKLYDSADYADLNFLKPEKNVRSAALQEVYRLTIYRSSKVLSRQAGNDTIYDDISIPIYSATPSQDLIQSVYLIFNQKTEKVCYKVLDRDEEVPGHHLYFQEVHTGCDLFGKYRIIDESTLGLNLMNADSKAFYMTCSYAIENGSIGQITFDQIDYKKGLSETQGNAAPPISFDQVFYTQMTFKDTGESYIYIEDTDVEKNRETVEISYGDPLTIKTKRGKTRNVAVKGYPFYLK